jgi:hypothetical protein
MDKSGFAGQAEFNSVNNDFRRPLDGRFLDHSGH